MRGEKKRKRTESQKVLICFILPFFFIKLVLPKANLFIRQIKSRHLYPISELAKVYGGDVHAFIAQT